MLVNQMTNGKYFEGIFRARLDKQMLSHIIYRAPDNNQSSQPVDILALGEVSWMFELKSCKEGNRFAFSRINENQRYWLFNGHLWDNWNAALVVSFGKGRGQNGRQIYCVPWAYFKLFEASWPKKSITKAQAATEWVDYWLPSKWELPDLKKIFL